MTRVGVPSSHIFENVAVQISTLGGLGISFFRFPLFVVHP